LEDFFQQYLRLPEVILNIVRIKGMVMLNLGFPKVTNGYVEKAYDLTLPF
jgi:hypothetical protein